MKDLNNFEKTKWAKFQTEAQKSDLFERVEGWCHILNNPGVGVEC